MISIEVFLAGDVPAQLAGQASSLCHADSEMQTLFHCIASGTPLSDRDAAMVIALGHDIADGEQTVIGWASVGEWFYEHESRLQVQAYVHPDYRRKGLGFSLIACASHGMPTRKPVAVFSDECWRVAQRLRWDAEQWRSVDDGWIRVRRPEGGSQGTGTVDAGVHAFASEVCGVPLASDTKGEAS